MKGQEQEQEERRGACYGKRDGRKEAMEGVGATSDLGVRKALATFMAFLHINYTAM